MANRTTRIILFTALVAPIATLAQTNGLPRPAYVVSNAYVEIRSSQPLWRNGGLDFLTVTNAAPPLDMVVTPMPGWELLTPPELHITDGLAGVWSVRGVLGETGAGGEMCIPMTTSNDTHMVAPSFRLPPPSTGSGGSGPSAESLPPISSGGPYVVASTSDTAMVSFSCAPTDLTNGVHECHTSFFSCPGGKTNWHREDKTDYQTNFDIFSWTWSCGGTNGVQNGMALNVGPLELHAGAHKVSAELEARYSGCVKCVYSDKAETNIVVSLLTVTCDPWIGLDRTGDPATPYESSNVTARASLDPANPGVAKVDWAYAGVCDRTDKRDWEMDVWATNREGCSGSYLEERVIAAACGASASTNFTVVKVDVEINGLDEASEESAGAYLAYVADTNAVRTIADTNGMVGVKFTCTPANLPPDEMVTIANSGHGELYLREGNALCLVTSTNIPAREIGGKTFLLHGHTASGEVLKDKITIEHPSSKAKDRAFYTVLKIDIDIDSDNDAPDGIPGRTAIEEDLEDVAGHPGRALALNELDIDKDWVPDYADGYDSTFPGAASEPDGSAKFIPLVLECGAIPPGAEVTIRYDENESDPAHLPDMAGNAGAGKVRLWAKDGDKARLKAAAPLGDFIPSGHRIPAAEIANGTLTYFIEAVCGSASPGDVVFTLRIEKGAANVSDAAKATVFHIGAVHPVAADFADGQVGKAMISTKQDDEYYTTNVTTRAGTPAQANDHEVVATAYVLPIPPDGYNPPTVYFEVTDPDDLSPYEGAPSPGAPGDANPNDNNDPAKAMKWNGGAPSDYGVYQMNALSAREDHPRKVVINGAGRYAAETTLRMTDRYAGDNYQMRATLQNPNGNPFDTLSGMTAPFKADTATSVKASETLIAWKRVYIEQDDMYKRGCTLTSTYSPMPGEIVGLGRLYVDSTADFSISDEVVVFWPNGSLSARVFDKTGDCLVILGPLQKLQKYSGVRLANSEDTYSCDGHFLENAFGKEANGEDGGAFIEFKSIGNPNCRVPKYAVFPSFAEVKNFASFWFDNVIKPNVVCLLVGTKVANRKAAGTTFDDWSICGILAERTTNLEDTVAHELGHRFSIRRNSQNFKHVDNWNEHQLAHNGCDECILSYNRNREDDNVEFCHFCLLTGSQVGASDSLRKVEDK